MKSAKLALALAISLSAQSAAFATQPSASGSGSVSIANTVSGNFAVGQNGSATSFAQNNEAATAKVTAMANSTPYHTAVNAGVIGKTTSESYGQAFNVSTGTGNGTASSVGSVNTGVQGAVAIHGVTTGFNGGNAITRSNNQVDAGTNQGSFVGGNTQSGFDTQIQYVRSATYTASPAGTTGGTRTSGVGIADQKSGYAGGSTSMGALDGMNAAGYANIGASGQFFAKAGLAASTGTVSAP